MTCKEFSDTFDVLLSSYQNTELFGKTNMSNLVFDEYEKSVFLTQAQEELLLELYSGKISGEGFEHTEEIRRYLESLNKKVTNAKATSTSTYMTTYDILEYSIQPDVWFITYEVLSKASSYKLVTPVTRDSLYNTLQNPFKVSQNRCLRVDGKDYVYIYGKNIQGSTYEYHYIVKPTPIVLVDLSDSNITIDGVNTETECAVHPALHRKILERAVALALQSKTIVNNKND